MEPRSQLHRSNPNASPDTPGPNNADGTVSVIDTATNTVVSTIDVGDNPISGVAHPDGRVVYVVNGGDSTISVIDPSSNTITATLEVGDSPRIGAMLPDGSALYIANGGSNSTTVIDTSSNTVVDTIETPWVRAGAAAPDGSTVYLLNWVQGLLLVVDTGSNTAVAEVPVGRDPTRLEVLPNGSAVYVSSGGDPVVEGGGSVTIMLTETNEVVERIDFRDGPPAGLRALVDGSAVYVASPTGGTMTMTAVADRG